MSFALVDHLQLLRSHCAPELITDKALERVSAMIEDLPPALTRAVLLEVRLAADLNDVDIPFMVERPTLEQLAVRGAAVGFSHPAVRAVSEVYARCLRQA